MPQVRTPFHAHGAADHAEAHKIEPKRPSAEEKALVAASPKSQLIESDCPKSVRGLTREQITLMERESANLEREFKMAEQSYGIDHLDLVLAKGYLAKLLGNARVMRYLMQNQQEILAEFQRITEMETTLARAQWLSSRAAVSTGIDGDADPISAGTAGHAALWGGSSAGWGWRRTRSGTHRGLAAYGGSEPIVWIVSWRGVAGRADRPVDRFLP